MYKFYILTLLLLTTVHQGGAASVIEWFWGKGTDDTTVQVADGVPLVSIPYESMTKDEKFLKEAAKFTEIQVSSPLETCQHKVIMKIKTSCSDMSEEDLAKLGVNLLNCQSAVEGRKMFPCTEEMSLKQCTTDMDADMWNAYHLMSNRARAVCYAARSTQFRALTELTVNKLMNSAHDQIEKLTALKEGQEKLEEQTVQALSSLSEGNQVLLEQQQYLKDAQTTAHQIVTTNLRELSNERALIRSGHAQLAAMAEDIKKKLEEASMQLVQQATESGENHREVLQDLIKIQDQAHEIWEKIESSTARIFQQQEEAIDQYEQTLHKLVQINDTIHFIWNVTNSMRLEIDEKLNWITSYIGDTGEQMHRMWRSALHIIYILFAMIVAAFLQAPFLTRLSILCIVPLNLGTFLKHGTEACLDFASMTVLILLITAMHYIMAGIQYIFVPKRDEMVQAQPRLVYQNGHTNGISNYSSTPVEKRHFRKPWWSIKQSLLSLYTVTVCNISGFAQKIRNIAESIFSWSRQDFKQEEQLSCSYEPSKKSREDLIYDYAREMPSMSEDDTDFEVSRTLARRNFSDDENLVDANDLRRRFTTMNRSDRSTRSASRASRYASSVAGGSTPPKHQCAAETRSGSRCRNQATNGYKFCARHSASSPAFLNSIM